MTISDGRRAELIAAAASGALRDDEAAELEAAQADDPTIGPEVEVLRETMRRARAALPTWIEPEAHDALRTRILGALPHADAEEPDAAPRAPERRHRARRRRRWAVPLLAVACLATGAGLGLALPAVLASPPTGPAGTLGAIEDVAVQDTLPGASIDAEIVAHTWGTEAILEARGLDDGAAYAIVLVGVDGVEHSAGAMLGSVVDIRCSVNAAVLRPDVARLEIRDADSRVVASADLPRI